MFIIDILTDQTTDYESLVAPVGDAVVPLDFIGDGEFKCHLELVPAGAEHGANSNDFFIAGPDKAIQSTATFGDSVTVTKAATQAASTITKAFKTINPDTSGSSDSAESVVTVTKGASTTNEPDDSGTRTAQAPKTVIATAIVAHTSPASNAHPSSTGSGATGGTNHRLRVCDVGLLFCAIVALLVGRCPAL